MTKYSSVPYVLMAIAILISVLNSVLWMLQALAEVFRVGMSQVGRYRNGGKTYIFLKPTLNTIKAFRDIFPCSLYYLEGHCTAVTVAM